MKLEDVTARLTRRLRAALTANAKPLEQSEKWQIIGTIQSETKVQILVETGTFLGDTIAKFKDQFEFLYSIELEQTLFKEAEARFCSDPHVQILQGDSGEILQTLVPTLARPSLFWLDGHYSSELFVEGRHIKTARGEKESPVFEELTAILSAPLNHVILIDDARLFGVVESYPSIHALRRLVKKNKPNYVFRRMKDVFAFLPNRSTQ